MQQKQSTRRPSLPTAHCPRPTRAAFTLTELLIVIAIIAVLASLIAAAAVNAWNNAQRNRIVLEIKNIGGALENFKNDYGAYPPNGMNPVPVATPSPGSEAALVRADFRRMFQQAFPQHQEPQQLIDALCGQNLNPAPPANGNLVNGMTAAESLCFWLGGFSEDEKYPITGLGGPSCADATGDNDGNLEASDDVLESRNWRYEFDITRLGPRNDDGTFDDAGRFVYYEIDLNSDGDINDPGEKRRINMWQFSPKGSEEPLVYFDVSRYKPYQYDAWASKTAYLFALKQLRSGATGAPANATDYQNNIVFVNQGKFQILHSGRDNAWGEDDFPRMSMAESTGLGWGSATFGGTDREQLLLYPTGPFLGDMADNLTSVTDGTLGELSE